MKRYPYLLLALCVLTGCLDTSHYYSDEAEKYTRQAYEHDSTILSLAGEAKACLKYIQNDSVYEYVDGLLSSIECEVEDNGASGFVEELSDILLHATGYYDDYDND